MADGKNVFISYSSKDIAVVNEVVNKLTAAGIEYWKAPEMIPAGSNYAREIPSAIAKCAAFLLFISDDSEDSIWVEKEVDCAINNRKTIVPLKITRGRMTDMFSFYLNNVQMIYYYDNKEMAITQIISRIRSLTGQEQNANVLDSNTRIETKNKRQNGINESGRRRLRTMDFYMNPQPVECRYCGGELEKISGGTYKCIKCARENYDYFRTVRNFLEENGPSTIMVIEHATGIPRTSIEYFLREEMLEIPKSNKKRLVCSRCGAQIRTGSLCETCKRLGAFGSGYERKR